MRSLSKAGGIAALYLAAAYLAAMPFFLLAVNYASLVDPLQKVASLAANRSAMHAMEFVVYVLFGLALVVLAIALHERLKAGAETLMMVATPIALIWAGLLIASGMIFNASISPVVALFSRDQAQAAALWSAVDTVSSGLSGDGEIVGGAWMLLASLAALQSRGLPKALNILGIDSRGRNTFGRSCAQGLGASLRARADRLVRLAGHRDAGREAAAGLRVAV